MPYTGYLQNPNPGGVEGVQLWLRPEIRNGQAVWADGNGVLVARHPGDSLSWLNYQPVIIPMKNQPFRLPLTDVSLPALTIFSVSDTRLSTEQSIWSLGRDTQADLINTNYRVADLSDRYFFNYPVSRSSGPVIQSYFKSDLDTTQDKFILWLGSRPANPSIPVDAYNGKLGEWLLFNRVLSPTERQKIDSYLAIKYGLTLDQSTPKNYLDADGSVIWDARSMAGYGHRIAGIGRDDKSALRTMQATSSPLPGLPIVSAGRLAISNATNSSTLPDRTFFTWGDDDQPVLWEESTAEISMLQRTWCGQWTGVVEGLKGISVYWDPELLPPPMPGNQYWLVVDTSGNTRFTPEGWWASSLDVKSGKLMESDMPDPQQKAKWLFSLMQGPSLFFKTWWDAPQCGALSPGILSVRVVGGKAPYRITLEQEGGVRTEATINKNFWEDQARDPGIYWLAIEDAEGRRYRQQLVLANGKTQNTVSGEKSYLLDGKDLDLKADHGSPEAEYTWILPDGSMHSGNHLQVDFPGHYTLLTREDGCLTERSFIVLNAAKTEPIALYPNLIAPGGAFRLVWENTEAAHLRVVSPSGQVIYRQELLKPGTYRIQPGIKQPGWFVVSIRQGQIELVSKLIVQ